jgi:hypothetical protein
VQLDLSSKKLGTLTKSVVAFQSDLKKVVVTAYASALAAAYNYGKESGCVAYVNAGGCIWTPGHPDEEFYCADCIAIAYSEGAVDSIDAIATASAPPSPLPPPWNCALGLCIPPPVVFDPLGDYCSVEDMHVRMSRSAREA